MKLHIKNLGALLIVGILASCAPGLGRSLAVNTIVIPGDTPRTHNGSAIHAQIRPFVDNRPSQTIALIDGREVNSSGDLAIQVRDAFESYLKESGVQLGDPDAPIIGGQISSWIAHVDPGFPTSEAHAEATLVVEVSNLSNQLVYSGKYTGNTVVKHPMLNESRISDALAEAMGYAIEEALHDQNLIEKIARTYHPIY